MKKIIMLIVFSILLSATALAYSSGTIEAEDGISVSCSDTPGSECIHWIAQSMTFGGASCSVTTETCTVGGAAWFTITDAPAVVPSGATCNITVAINATATTNEDISVSVNGGSVSTISDPGTGNFVSQFPASFTFVGGSSGSDEITFSGASTAVKFDWYTLECTDAPAVPEFSTMTLGLGLIAVLAGIVIIRRKNI